MPEQSDEDVYERGGIASETLLRLAQKAEASPTASLTLGEVVDTMGRTSIAFTILILALPALTPIPGPFGMVFGSCLAIVSLQIIAGFRHIWLPGFLERRQIPASVLKLVIRYTQPMMTRIERFLKADRLAALTGRRSQTLLGIPVFLLAFAVALPIPFGNLLPVLALVVIATALMEKDGLAVLVGLVLTCFALGVTGGLLYGSASIASYLYGWL